MGLFRRRKRSLKDLSLEELEKYKIILDNKIRFTTKKIKKLQERKKQLFNQGLNASNIERRILAREISHVENNIKSLKKELDRLMRKQRIVEEFIKIKKDMSTDKGEAIDKIIDIDLDEIQYIIAEKERLENKIKDTEEFLVDVMTYEPPEDEAVTSEEKKVLDLWEAYDRKEMSLEDIEDKLFDDDKKKKERERDLE